MTFVMPSVKMASVCLHLNMIFCYISLEVPVKEIATANGEAVNSEDLSAYKWSQTSEFVSVVFSLPESTKKEDITCDLTQSTVRVELKDGTKLLSGNLEKDIDLEASKWIFEKQRYSTKEYLKFSFPSSCDMCCLKHLTVFLTPSASQSKRPSKPFGDKNCKFHDALFKVHVSIMTESRNYFMRSLTTRKT